MPSPDESNQPKGYVRPKKQDRDKRFFVEVEEDAKATAVSMTKGSKLSMKVAISTLIDLWREYDLLKEGWHERLNLAMALGEGQLQKNRFEALDDPCPKLKYANERWNCVQGTGSKLKIKTLSKELIDAIELCQGCGAQARAREREAFFGRRKTIRMKTDMNGIVYDGPDIQVRDSSPKLIIKPE